MRQQTILDRYLDGRIGPDHRASAEGNQAGEEPTTSELLARASAGDQVAWDQLVDRHGRLAWTVARAHGLDLDEAADASHLTWLLLAQHLGKLQQPERLEQWLATTARRESERIRALRSNLAVVADELHPLATQTSNPHRCGTARDRGGWVWSGLTLLAAVALALAMVVATWPWSSRHIRHRPTPPSHMSPRGGQQMAQ